MDYKCYYDDLTKQCLSLENMLLHLDILRFFQCFLKLKLIYLHKLDMDISVYEFYRKVDNIDDDEEEVENKLLDNLSLKEKINVIKYFNKELTK